jgi:hypothetical protein
MSSTTSSDRSCAVSKEQNTMRGEPAGVASERPRLVRSRCRLKAASNRRQSSRNDHSAARRADRSAPPGSKRACKPRTHLHLWVVHHALHAREQVHRLPVDGLRVNTSAQRGSSNETRASHKSHDGQTRGLQETAGCSSPNVTRKHAWLSRQQHSVQG